ncbi:outer membrane beta-barrel protein [Pseudomonadota bacterium]
MDKQFIRMRAKNSPYGLFILLSMLCWGLTSLPNQAWAETEYREVQVAEPFLELRSGPGRGFPVFHIVDRDEHIKIIKRKTEWFKIETDRNVYGWAHMDQLLLTLTPIGERMSIKDTDEGDFVKRRSEIGILGGDFSGAQVITLYGGYILTPNISSELSVSQALGDISSKTIINVRLLHQAFPEWKFSPFFALGVGNIKTTPHATLVQTSDRSDMLSHAGLGVKTHLTQHLMLRAEFNKFVVFSSDDFNEELKEWKVGLAFFY